MSAQEYPTIAACNYSATAVDWDLQNETGEDPAFCIPENQVARAMRRVQPQQFFAAQLKPQNQPPQTKEEIMTRRIVQVFIADTNENVPLEKSVLYKGEQKLTDLSDQELFFEIPIKDTLDKHNADRVKMLDKDASRKSGKDIVLEPARIRDLKMLVVNIAQF